MKLKYVLALFCMTVSIGLSPASGKEPQTVTTARQARTRVYVRDFTYAGGAADDQTVTENRDLVSFLTTLIRLRLSEVESLDVLPLKEEPTCGFDQGQFQSKSQAAARDVTTTQGPVYIVGGQLTSLPAEEDRGQGYQLSYDLARWEACRQMLVFHSSEGFSKTDTFQDLTTMVEVLYSQLAKDLNQGTANGTAVDIGAIEGASSPDERVIADELRRFLAVGLVQAGDLLPRDVRTQKSVSPAPYRIDIKLEFERGLPLAFNILLVKKPALKRVRATISITDSAQALPYTADSVEADIGQDKGKDQNLSAFYLAASKAALDKLNDGRYAREANLPALLSETPPAEKLKRAKELLCRTAESRPDCQSSPKKALPLLQSLTKEKNFKPNDEVLDLLGRSLSATGDDRAAALAFDQAKVLVGETDVPRAILFSNLAGDSWYNAHEYATAADRYADSLRLSAAHLSSLPPSLPRQPIIRLQRARSLRLAGKRADALTEALEGLREAPQSDELKREITQVIDSSTQKELFEVVPILQASAAQLQVSSLLSTAQRRLAGVTLLLGEQEYASGDFNSLDDNLKHVESLPSDALSTADRERLLRLRSVWYRDRMRNFERAVELLQQASALGVGKGQKSLYELALTYDKWGQASTPASAASAYYNKTIPILTKLVAERYTDADLLLREVNHGLAQDEKTREVLEGIIAGSPRDVSALVNLMFVCNEYLLDLNCAVGNALSAEKAGALKNNPDLELDVAEIETLAGSYDEATKHVASALNLPAQDVVSQAVGHFYEVWLSLARSRREEAQKNFGQWQAALENLRKTQMATDWVFNGAKRALGTERHLSAEQKEFLLSMIRAMEDQKQPVPRNIAQLSLQAIQAASNPSTARGTTTDS